MLYYTDSMFFVYLRMKNTRIIVDTDLYPRLSIIGNTFKSPRFHYIDSWDNFPEIYKQSTPFYCSISCCIIFERGTLACSVNGVTVVSLKRSFMIVPPNSVIKIIDFSGDLKLKIASLPENDAYDHVIHFPIDSFKTYKRLLSLFNLCGSYIADSDIPNTVLVQSLISNEIEKSLLPLSKIHKSQNGSSVTQNFFSLLNTCGGYRHSIPFYAQKLSVTPNWLSNIIKKKTEHSVLYWISTYLIQQAKIDLAYTEKPINEISAKLGFASDSDFARVFKRITLKTPSQYRKEFAFL